MEGMSLYVDGRPIQDVFDTTGLPERGWMHAIFGGGPLHDEVGRCVPGPPAPNVIDVLTEGRMLISYQLRTVGSWSDPSDPIAIYVE